MTTAKQALIDSLNILAQLTNDAQYLSTSISNECLKLKDIVETNTNIDYEKLNDFVNQYSRYDLDYIEARAKVFMSIDNYLVEKDNK